MGKKKSASTKRTKTPRSFTGVIRGRSREVQAIAKALRELVTEELPDAVESFYGGQKPMAMYRTIADVCWIQPLKERCNIYFTQGAELTDAKGVLEGSSDRIRYVKVKSPDAVDELPLRQFLGETVELNDAATRDGLTTDEVLERLRDIALSLPETHETITWGKPHFRVNNKIFCGCGEQKGAPSIGLKLPPRRSQPDDACAGNRKGCLQSTE